MPEEQTAIVRLFYPEGLDYARASQDEAFLDGLREIAAEVIDPDFELVVYTGIAGPGIPGFSGSLHGFEPFLDWWQEWLAGYESFFIEIQEIRELDASVLVLLRMRGRTRHAGVEVVQDGAADWRFSEGRITGIHQYTDQAHALRELGLSSGGG